MNQALELAGKTLSACATDETWGQLAQVFKDGPEEFLGHLGRTHFVRMGKVVAGGGVAPRMLDSGPDCKRRHHKRR